jgi:hypothetical protein
VMFILTALIAAAVLLGVYFLIRAGQNEYSANAEQLRKINELPIARAEQLAFSYLQDAQLFICDDSKGVDPQNVASLPTAVRELFARYRRVAAVSGPKAWINRELVPISFHGKQYLQIGAGMEATDTPYRICLTGNGEQIVELYEGEEPDLSFGTYPTVFHWVVALAEEQLQEPAINRS